MKTIKNTLIVLFIIFVTTTINAQSNDDYENIVLGKCITGDCENGYGVFIYPNKNKYIGEYKNGLKNGFGIEVDPKGNYVYGNWKNNKEDGYVRIFNKNNELIFAVEMKDGKPLKKLNSNGVEVGCLTGDCENGFGHYLYDNGDKYIGEWKNGLMQGYSTYRSENPGHKSDIIIHQICIVKFTHFVEFCDKI